jgi:uncharacterized protein YkwD
MTRTRTLAWLAGPRRLTLLVALVFGATSVGVLAVPRSVFGWEDSSFGPGSETRLIEMHNQARAAAGLTVLDQDPALRDIARWRSRDMVERDYFSHAIEGTDRRVFWYMEHEYAYCFTLAGENIGTVTWRGASEEDATNWVFDAFMASSGHRANVLGEAWDAVAVGAYRTTGDTFVWTVLFADRCSTSTPFTTPIQRIDPGLRAPWGANALTRSLGVAPELLAAAPPDRVAGYPSIAVVVRGQ